MELSVPLFCPFQIQRQQLFQDLFVRQIPGHTVLCTQRGFVNTACQGKIPGPVAEKTGSLIRTNGLRPAPAGYGTNL
jgi:hypothetical protein